jgi:hypothetical protein
MEGTHYCGYHAATCPGVTKSGEPCQMSKEFCRYHRDADASDERQIKSKSMSANKHVCQGVTQKGKPCRIMVREEQEYCHFHGGDDE